MTEEAMTPLQEEVLLDQWIQVLIQLNSIACPVALQIIKMAQEIQKEYYDKNREDRKNTCVLIPFADEGRGKAHI